MAGHAVSSLVVLVTRGRRSGREHAVTLRTVLDDDGRYYFSRRRPNSDWFKNALYHGAADIIVDGGRISGSVDAVTDKDTIRRISMLKYADAAKASIPRVAIRVTPRM